MASAPARASSTGPGLDTGGLLGGESGWTTPEACLFCGSHSFMPWLDGIRDQLGYVPGSWALLRCGACGSAQISPVPAPEKVPGLYPPVYSFRPDFDTGSRARGLIARAEAAAYYRLLHERETASIMRHTGLNGGSMLDVGCGTGERMLRFARAGFAVRGLEIQPELVAYLRDSLRLAADAGTLDTFSYDDDSFDLVTIHYVIEHLLDVKTALRKIYAMLKPGGWIVAEVPLADSFQSQMLRTRWNQFSEAPRHVAVPSREGIRLALAECGFEDVTLVPATAMSCASAFALSVIPSAGTPRAYGKNGLLGHLPRVAAGILMLSYLPAAAAENQLLRRPAFARVLARKRA